MGELLELAMNKTNERLKLNVPITFEAQYGKLLLGSTLDETFTFNRVF